MAKIKSAQIQHLIDQAKRRWLEPAEICKILENLPKSHISEKVPNRPPGGSVFFYDWNVLRRFRKDGYNWRKNRDGTLAKEAHERLKCGSVGVLQCYYSYGDDGDQNIRRRIYWTINKELSHIAFVHYLEVEGTAMIEGNGGNINGDSSAAPMVQPYNYERAPPVTETIGLNTTQASKGGEAEPVYGYQASPGLQSIQELQPPAMQTMDAGSITYHPVPISKTYQEQSSAVPDLSFGSIGLGEVSQTAMDNVLTYEQALGSHSDGLKELQASDRQPLHIPSINQQSDGNLNLRQNHCYPSFNDPTSNQNDDDLVDIENIYDTLLQNTQVYDLVVFDPTMQPGPGPYLETVPSQLHNNFLGPPFSQDQLFSIIDFLPNWAYSGFEIKVKIEGKFLRSQEQLENYKWACMFGELEVPAEIVRDGVLQCHTPVHGPGRVPLYITSSNRLAYSEKREFVFVASSVENVNSLMRTRFGKLLSIESGTPQISVQTVGTETFKLCSKISELLKDNTKWEQLLSRFKQDQLSADEVNDQLLQKLLKKELQNWLHQKIVEGGIGLNVLDEDGQGVLHFAAALGYDWAIRPTIAAGVNVNLRDANGWTALHWAAYCGRERIVNSLICAGATREARTDPSPTHPSGRAPADLVRNRTSSMMIAIYGGGGGGGRAIFGGGLGGMGGFVYKITPKPPIFGEGCGKSIGYFYFPKKVVQVSMGGSRNYYRF